MAEQLSIHDLLYKAEMGEELGTHDLYRAEIGEEFGSTEVTITKDMVEWHAFGCDDYNPWYMEDSPFGGRIVSPTFLMLFQHPLFIGYYAPIPGDLYHYNQEMEFINPLKIGKKVKVTGKFLDRYQKRGRDYFTFGFLFVDEDGTEILRAKRTYVSVAVHRE